VAGHRYRRGYRFAALACVAPFTGDRFRRSELLAEMAQLLIR
jgi:hypothetical protein